MSLTSRSQGLYSVTPSAQTTCQARRSGGGRGGSPTAISTLTGATYANGST